MYLLYFMIMYFNDDGLTQVNSRVFETVPFCHNHDPGHLAVLPLHSEERTKNFGPLNYWHEKAFPVFSFC